MTSHKSQGRTCDEVIVCAARLDAKAAYVAFSRARQRAAGYTPEQWIHTPGFWASVIHPEERQQVLAAPLQVLVDQRQHHEAAVAGQELAQQVVQINALLPRLPGQLALQGARHPRRQLAGEGAVVDGRRDGRHRGGALAALLHVLELGLDLLLDPIDGLAARRSLPGAVLQLRGAARPSFSPISSREKALA